MQPNNISPITSNAPANDDRATYATLADVGAAFSSGIAAILEAHEARIAALEAALVVSPQPDVVPFAQSRPSWTVKQLASDLNMNEQTIRNFLALPDGHQQKLHSFQANPGGAHHLLPEHVADWLRRNESQAA